jgi:hypothetical protein
MHGLAIIARNLVTSFYKNFYNSPLSNNYNSYTILHANSKAICIWADRLWQIILCHGIQTERWNSAYCLRGDIQKSILL